MKLLTAKQFTKTLGTFTTNAEKQEERLQELAQSALAFALRSKDTDQANALVNALPNSYRRKAMVQYLNQAKQIKFDKESNSFVPSKAKGMGEATPDEIVDAIEKLTEGKAWFEGIKQGKRAPSAEKSAYEKITALIEKDGESLTQEQLAALITQLRGHLYETPVEAGNDDDNGDELTEEEEKILAFA